MLSVPMTDLLILAQSSQQRVQEHRAELHRRAETRYETTKTRKYIFGALSSAIDRARNNAHGYKVDLSEFKGGIVLDITFDQFEKRVALRADFDALPVQENTGLEFSSENKGKMHACGHDIHSAALLTFAELVLAGKIRPVHNLRIYFQDAEENPGNPPNPKPGSVVMIEEGLLDGVAAAFAFHVVMSQDGEGSQPGVFYSREGAILGNSGRIQILITCAGGHAARPHKGVNAARIVQAIMNGLSDYPVNKLGPFQPAVLDPLVIEAGQASNVLANTAMMWYSARTMLPADEHAAYLDLVKERIQRIVGGFSGAKVTFNVVLGHPATINDPIMVQHTAKLITGVGEAYQEAEPSLGGEDFAFVLQRVPGAFVFLGAGQGEHHTPTFNPDQSVFWKGVLLYSLWATNPLPQ